MIDFPYCPNCGNISSYFLIEKNTLSNKTTDAVICNGCDSVVTTFLSCEDVEEMINDRVRDIEEKIED